MIILPPFRNKKAELKITLGIYFNRYLWIAYLEPLTYIYKEKKVLFTHFNLFVKIISEHLKNAFLL